MHGQLVQHPLNELLVAGKELAVSAAWPGLMYMPLMFAFPTQFDV